MKKLAFVLGYAGGILALVFSLVMIYTVPLSLVNNTMDDIKDSMNNDNVIALNEVLVYAKDHPIADFSENGLLEYAKNVSGKSEILSDDNVYEDSVVFAYKTVLGGIISAVLIGVSIIFALFAFIGALVCRKKPAGGGVMMLIASLVLLLCAIYTGTVLPTVVASALLAGAGIIVFIPVSEAAQQRASRPKAPRVKAAPQFAQYPQQPVQYPQYAQPYQQQYPQQPYQQAQFVQYAQPAPAAQPAASSDVPFPDEDVQVFAQPAADEDLKE